jgi:hypothetical protein
VGRSNVGALSGGGQKLHQLRVWHKPLAAIGVKRSCDLNERAADSAASHLRENQVENVHVRNVYDAVRHHYNICNTNRKFRAPSFFLVI